VVLEYQPCEEGPLIGRAVDPRYIKLEEEQEVRGEVEEIILDKDPAV
jgi:hypothetical protein